MKIDVQLPAAPKCGHGGSWHLSRPTGWAAAASASTRSGISKGPFEIAALLDEFVVTLEIWQGCRHAPLSTATHKLYRSSRLVTNCNTQRTLAMSSGDDRSLYPLREQKRLAKAAFRRLEER